MPNLFAADKRRSEAGPSPSSFVANGARSVLNSFMLDGVDNNARIVDQQNSSNVGFEFLRNDRFDARKSGL